MKDAQHMKGKIRGKKLKDEESINTQPKKQEIQDTQGMQSMSDQSEEIEDEETQNTDENHSSGSDGGSDINLDELGGVDKSD